VARCKHGAGMKNTKRQNNVRSLVNLYTVVIGVALSLAVIGIVDTEHGLASATPSSILLFVAFVATLFPFFHGALRHLDDAYIENPTHIHDGALVIDFILLFIHAMAFVVLSVLLKKPTHFAWVLLILISIDVVWGIFATFASSTRGDLKAESKWTIINFIFVGISATYLVKNDIYLDDLEQPLKLAIPIAFASVLRTIADYVWCRNFYFPK
jgi:hypothetical protein